MEGKLGYQPEKPKPEKVKVFSFKDIMKLALLLILGQWKFVKSVWLRYKIIKKANSIINEPEKFQNPPKGSGVPKLSTDTTIFKGYEPHPTLMCADIGILIFDKDIREKINAPKLHEVNEC